MEIIGIKTHNLKNIDFTIDDNSMVGIYGVSGGGKSSLAYSTIYNLCSATLSSLENGYIDSSDYVVDSYKDLIPSVAIKQLNKNTNPRSTIYSYLNIASKLSIIKDLNIDYDLLKLNKPTNECQKCFGKGEISHIINNEVVDENIPISQIPFIAWKSAKYGNNMHEILLQEFCKSNNIDTQLSLKDLSTSDYDKLLNATDTKAYLIKYKHNKKVRQKREKFVGYFTWIKDLLASNKISEHKSVAKYATTCKCPFCQGTKINKEKYSNLSLFNISFFDFLSMSIDEILLKINRNHKSCDILYNTLQAISSLGIGYLSLSRSIPTLSGGELQKLNFANLINSKMSNLLIILDEISSGLHITDFDIVLDYITQLKQAKNNIIMVEHNHYFLSKCDKLIQIGPKSGSKGGNIIYEKLQIKSIGYKSKNLDIKDFISINDITINNIYNQNIKIAKNSINAIVGKSGSGKSSLSKYIEENIEHSIYISQKSIKGNIKSTFASYLGINKNIADFFGKFFNLDYSFFMTNSYSEIVCKSCNGNGIIKYERGYESTIDIVCPECEGKLFNQIATKYIIDGYSITDIYNQELSTLSNFSKIKKLNKFFELIKKLSLSHLSLNRKTSTLSGGELKRLKLLKVLLNGNLKNKILIIDEIGSGLDEDTASKVISLIKEYKNKTISLIIIEHKPEIFFEADYIIEIGPNAGISGGKIIFNDTTDKYYNNFTLRYKDIFRCAMITK
jgi:excinuclease ABC subunit A